MRSLPENKISIIAVALVAAGLAPTSFAEDRGLALERRVIDDEGPHNPWTKIIGDVDGDGYADVIIGGQKGPLVWYAWPKWNKSVIADGGYATVDGEMGDIDRDGDLDVVMGGTLWYENPRPQGDPAKAPWPPHRIEQLKSHDIELADLDGDGDLDVVGRDQGKSGDVIKLWRQDGPDQWTARDLAVPKGEGLRVGDLDGDGDADVVIGGRWYENPGRIVGGRWAEHVFGKWHETSVVEIADINQDGRSDVVLTASEAVYKGSWFEGPADRAAGPWKEHVIDDSLDFAHGVWAVDIDGDGDRDVVTAEMHQSRRDRVLVYLNQRDGLKWDRIVLSTKGSHDVFIADVGKDGDLDILGANWSGPYQPVELWENRRHGSSRGGSGGTIHSPTEEE